MIRRLDEALMALDRAVHGLGLALFLALWVAAILTLAPLWMLAGIACALTDHFFRALTIRARARK